ncbi:hypothetical protein BDN70DRAFT_878318 [Pholiota conissans]|uniref:Uncharacterized protein n=1 Tax=Pholiota conissans TaxID=109636 RepID=A0A9P5Z2Z4_9AGAR|nr:hypothetical protein BDN70DRAFT_878318 [Pholiota conissans]
MLRIFPWAQLTHLYLLRMLSFHEFENLIQRCANVKVVAFIKYGHPPVAKPDGCIVVENLRQFAIASNEYIMRISLSAFSFPNLTAFRFVVGLQTYDFFREMADLEGVFTAMPALRELRFDVPMLLGEGDCIPHEEVQGHRSRWLSSYLPHLEYFVIDSIESNGKNVGANIIKILKSDWLCSGWESPCERKLELIGSKSRLPHPVVVPSHIIAEVSAFLQSHWHFDSTPFEVSIRAEESERSAFDVFEEENSE